jgi:aldose 1-epimerase
VNGREYRLNEALGNIRPDGNKNPIHGLVLYTDRWQQLELVASSGAATYRARLDFHRYPEWMAQFPFAHSIEMTYRLAGGVLEVITEITNVSAEPLPVAIGFHPYYRLPGGRDAWTLTIPAREHVDLTDKLIPSGKRSPLVSTSLPLKGNQQDDVYTSLITGAKGFSEFAMTDGKRKIVFGFGPKYPVGVVYAPPGRDFVCFEPMAAITDAFNQHARGQYGALQTVPAGGKWSETWTIHPTGY